MNHLRLQPSTHSDPAYRTKLLLVDPSPIDRARLALVLALLEHRFELREAANAAELFQLLETDTPDLVLAEWHLPDACGADIAKALERRGLGPRLGFVTHSAETARHYSPIIVPKPVTLTGVEAAAGSLLGSGRCFRLARGKRASEQASETDSQSA